MQTDVMQQRKAKSKKKRFIIYFVENMKQLNEIKTNYNLIKNCVITIKLQHVLCYLELL